MRKNFSFFLFCFCIGILCHYLLACGERKASQFKLADRNISYEANDLFQYSADILWVVDNSHTMKKYQELLLSQMDSFLRAFSELKMNFHLGLTSMDMRLKEGGGQLIGSPAILTPKIKSWESLFKQRFLLGEEGSPQERGLDSIEALLTQTEDFIRPQAVLVLIFLSDEEDVSLKDTQHYIDFLNTIKPMHPRTQKKVGRLIFLGFLPKKTRDLTVIKLIFVASNQEQDTLN